VALLAGPGGDYITGQVLTIDGGRSLWGNTWPLPDDGPPAGGGHPSRAVGRVSPTRPERPMPTVTIRYCHS